MAKSQIAAALALGVMASMASAQTWPLEPTALRGVSLGGQLQDYRECPRTTGPLAAYIGEWEPKFKEAAGDAPCWRKNDPRDIFRGRKLQEIANLPQVDGLGQAVGITLSDEKIAEVEVQFLSSNFDMISTSVIERYGAPTAKESRMLQDGRGRGYSSRVFTWRGAAALMTLEEHRVGPPDFGYLTLSSRDYAQSLLRAREKAGQKIKSAL